MLTTSPLMQYFFTKFHSIALRKNNFETAPYDLNISKMLTTCSLMQFSFCLCVLGYVRVVQGCRLANRYLKELICTSDMPQGLNNNYFTNNVFHKEKSVILKQTYLVCVRINSLCVLTM